jgi:hypothetical protein
MKLGILLPVEARYGLPQVVENMPTYKNERELVSKWAKPLLKQQGYIAKSFVGYDKLHAKLTGEQTLGNEELKANWPGQPEIDLVYWSGTHVGDTTIYAAEVKYFRFKKKGKLLYPEIYDGVGEALAYLGFGFDYVFLWHVFDSELPNDLVTRSRSHVESFIGSSQATINYRTITLPIDHSTSPMLAAALKPLTDITSQMQIQTFFSMPTKFNQMKFHNEAMMRRNIIRKAFRIL